MRERTRDALLWLAGVGGAVVVANAAIDLLTKLALGFYYASGLTLVGLLVAGAVVALALVRSRLKDHPEPVAFTENRP